MVTLKIDGRDARTEIVPIVFQVTLCPKDPAQVSDSFALLHTHTHTHTHTYTILVNSPNPS